MMRAGARGVDVSSRPWSRGLAATRWRNRAAEQAMGKLLEAADARAAAEAAIDRRCRRGSTCRRRWPG